jgi:hypothetical protein
MDGALLSPVALTTADILALVIFDTGASLAISPHRSDFVDDPTPLVRPTRLLRRHGQGAANRRNWDGCMDFYGKRQFGNPASRKSILRTGSKSALIKPAEAV